MSAERKDENSIRATVAPCPKLPDWYRSPKPYACAKSCSTRATGVVPARGRDLLRARRGRLRPHLGCADDVRPQRRERVESDDLGDAGRDVARQPRCSRVRVGDPAVGQPVAEERDAEGALDPLRRAGHVHDQPVRAHAGHAQAALAQALPHGGERRVRGAEAGRELRRREELPEARRSRRRHCGGECGELRRAGRLQDDVEPRACRRCRVRAGRARPCARAGAAPNRRPR